MEIKSGMSYQQRKTNQKLNGEIRERHSQRHQSKTTAIPSAGEDCVSAPGYAFLRVMSQIEYLIENTHYISLAKSLSVKINKQHQQTCRLSEEERELNNLKGKGGWEQRVLFQIYWGCNSYSQGFELVFPQEQVCCIRDILKIYLHLKMSLFHYVRIS